VIRLSPFIAIYCGRGASGAACGVVAFGLAGSGAAGGTGARCWRPVVSLAVVVAVRSRLPLAANARIPARRRAPIMAGVTQPRRSPTRLLSGFTLSRASISPLGSFNVIGHFLVVGRIQPAIAERVPSLEDPHAKVLLNSLISCQVGLGARAQVATFSVSSIRLKQFAAPARNIDLPVRLTLVEEQ
jgi:hypothetical protein